MALDSNGSFLKRSINRVIENIESNRVFFKNLLGRLQLHETSRGKPAVKLRAYAEWGGSEQLTGTIRWRG
jgi:hypothetical protein